MNDLCPRHKKPKITNEEFHNVLLSHGGGEGAICVLCGEFIPPEDEDKLTGLTREQAYDLGRSDERLIHST